MKRPFATIRRSKCGLHTFTAFRGTKSEEKELLQNCLEGIEQIFGRRATRRCVKRVFGKGAI